VWLLAVLDDGRSGFLFFQAQHGLSLRNCPHQVVIGFSSFHTA
jgi:hypothetical protein